LELGLRSDTLELRVSADGVISILGLGAGMIPGLEAWPKEGNPRLALY
jgi:hypothetical protein